MPLYDYRCDACGHEQEFLQKLSDAPIRVCPACGKESFVKKLTAAGFQLKGSGWYATDFKSGDKGKAKPEAKAEGGDKPASTDTKPDSASKSEASSTAAPACGSGGCAACS